MIFRTPQGTPHEITSPVAPDTCPVCHHAAEIKVCGEPVVRLVDGQDRFQVPYRCPRKTCGALFITEFLHEIPLRGGGAKWRTVGFSPLVPKPTKFPDTIGKLSPSFVAIHAQATRAGDLGMADLHGMGLRKSLEYLIKDYCITKAATDAEKASIKSAPLGSVIKDRVKDTNVKLCAERAVWLGNDETHYTKKWDADISDLQRLVTLTVNWIDNELTTEAYLKQMPQGK